jgi:hypothetical protein
MAYASSLPAARTALAPAIPASASSRPRRGFWRRLYNTIIMARRRQADREIERYLRSIGGTLTDHAEREIERRYLDGRPS